MPYTPRSSIVLLTFQDAAVDATTGPGPLTVTLEDWARVLYVQVVPGAAITNAEIKGEGSYFDSPQAADFVPIDGFTWNKAVDNAAGKIFPRMFLRGGALKVTAVQRDATKTIKVAVKKAEF